MNNSPTKEGVTISIRDMLLYVCSKWRILIICMIIGAVVLGLYSGYKSTRNTGGGVISDEQAAGMASWMSATDLANAQNCATTFMHYLGQYGFYANYNEKSKFQNMDAEFARVRSLTYYVDAEDASKAEGIAKIYELNVINDGFISAVAQKFGVDEEESFFYYDGMITFGHTDEAEANSEAYSNLSRTIARSEDTETSGGTFVVNVYGETDEYAGDLAEIVKASVEDVYADMSGDVSPHTISLVNEVSRKAGGTYIYDRQETYINNTKALLAMSSELLSGLDGNLVTYTRYLISKQYNGDYINVLFADGGGTPSFHISKKYVLLGLIAGLIASIIVIIIVYMVRGVVRCYDDIEYTYGIQVLGTYDDPKVASKSHKFILDRWLKSLRIRRKSQEREDSASLIAMKLQLLARNLGVSNICVALGPDVNVDETFMDDVVQKSEGINISVASNILRSADAIEKMLDADGVVLLEQMDKSKFHSIDEERCMCAGNNIKILGVIVAE